MHTSMHTYEQLAQSQPGKKSGTIKQSDEYIFKCKFQVSKLRIWIHFTNDS